MKGSSKMRKKWFAFLMINIFAILTMKPSFAGEAFVTTKDYTGATFVQASCDKDPCYLNWTRSYWDTNRHSYSLDQTSSSVDIVLPIDLPVPLEIDSSVLDAFDRVGRSRPAPKWEEKNFYPTFGIKYSFSRFELGDFAKSLVSLFTNMTQKSHIKGHRDNRPTSFYLAFPEY